MVGYCLFNLLHDSVGKVWILIHYHTKEEKKKKKLLALVTMHMLDARFVAHRSMEVNDCEILVITGFKAF